jgi:hypothetical protein
LSGEGVEDELLACVRGQAASGAGVQRRSDARGRTG